MRAAEGGALLQMQDGRLWRYTGQGSQGMSPCGPASDFPLPCPYVVPTPLAAVQQLGKHWLHHTAGILLCLVQVAAKPASFPVTLSPA